MTDFTPDEQKLIPLLKDLRFLIADPTSSRKSLRSLLSEYSVKPERIDVVETAADALAVLNAKACNVIIADYSIGAQPCFDLVRIQGEKVAPGELRCFFMLTNQDSNSLVTSAASESIDAIIVKPFSFGILRERFTQTLTEKLAPTPYVQALDKGRAFIKSENFDAALITFHGAKKLDPKPALACAYEGEIYQKQGKHDKALPSFEEGLRHNPTHFRSLLGIIDSLVALNQNEKAYSYARIFAENHTVPAKRIPDMIRLSIVNQHFEDVVGFYQTAGDLSSTDETIASHLGAGLVICGLQFLKRDDKPAALDAFRKAEVASKQNPRILMRILQALVSAGMESEMKAFLSRVPDEIRNSPEVQLSEVEFLLKSGAQLRALEQCLNLIRQGVKLERLFEAAIQISLQLQRKDSLIEDLVFKAGVAFPEKKESFEKLVVKKPS